MQILPRCRFTLRLRAREATSRAPALVDKAVTVTDSPLEPVRMFGLDETWARSLRWVWEDDGWRLSNP